MQQPYPKAPPAAGKLLRILIRDLKRLGWSLPLSSQILCAVSGGADSLALGILLRKYGRRVVPPQNLSWIHVNHGWRGRESDQDQEGIQELAGRFEVPLQVLDARRERPAAGESPEDHARKIRLRAFDRAVEVLGVGAWVFTAHHYEDDCKTVLWRILTDAPQPQWGGIRPVQGRMVRPLLNTRREDLQAFLREEGIAWREDSSNRDPRYLRARIRHELMPVIQQIFPAGPQALKKIADRNKK